MLSSDLIRKIQQIEIRTHHLVHDSFTGEYHSVFKGRGMEFDEVRPYQPGGEIRTIDTRDPRFVLKCRNDPKHPTRDGNYTTLAGTRARGL